MIRWMVGQRFGGESYVLCHIPRLTRNNLITRPTDVGEIVGLHTVQISRFQLLSDGVESTNAKRSTPLSPTAQFGKNPQFS